ncbi:MAG: hypothetical protein RIC35_22905 [Marinoscillum sp.]
MKFLKKALRLFVLIIIISLASIGVGIGGAILPTFHRQDSFLTNVEMVEERDEDELEDNEKE